MPNCFECFHFDYHSRLSRYGGEGSVLDAVENVAVHDFGLDGVGSVWKFFGGMKRLSVVVDHYWAVGLQRRHPVEKMVETLLERARENLPELAGKADVLIRAVSGEKMRGGMERGLVGLGLDDGYRERDARDLLW